MYDYSVYGDDHIIDEKGNAFIALRRVAWGTNRSEDKAKLEIRKYYNNATGDETPAKGVAFLTDEGPHNLTHELLDMGFGNTEVVLEKIKDREDFEEALIKTLDNVPEQLEDKVQEITDSMFIPSDNMLDYEEE